MPRRANDENLQALQVAIEVYPGKPAGFFSRLLRWRRQEVTRKLVMLNDRGVLLWEDERGGLWPYDDPAS